MLMTEWNWDDAKEVWQDEAREEGIELGLERGREEGLEKGYVEKTAEIARNMLMRNHPLSEIAEITGLSLEAVEQLKNEG